MVKLFDLLYDDWVPPAVSLYLCVIFVLPMNSKMIRLGIALTPIATSNCSLYSLLVLQTEQMKAIQVNPSTISTPKPIIPRIIHASRRTSKVLEIIISLRHKATS